MYIIWRRRGIVVGTSRVFLDFRFVAPFGNCSHLKGKLRLNFTLFIPCKIDRRMGKIYMTTGAYLGQSSLLLVHVLDFRGGVSLRNHIASPQRRVDRSWAPAGFFPGVGEFIGIARIFSLGVHFFPQKS